MWQPIILMPLKSMEGVQLILSQIWAPRMGSWPPYILSSDYDPDSHRYMPSPRNQRIEAWWGFFRKSHSTWWINFFKDMVEGRVVDLTLGLEMECLWFCFFRLLQKILDEVKEH